METDSKQQYEMMKRKKNRENLDKKIHTFWKQWKYSVTKKIYEKKNNFLVGKEYEAIFDLIQWQIDFCAHFYVEKKNILKQWNA